MPAAPLPPLRIGQRIGLQRNSARRRTLGDSCCKSIMITIYRDTVSLRLNVGGHIIPANIDVPNVYYTSPTDGSIKRLASHSVNFSGLDLSTAIRIHL